MASSRKTFLAPVFLSVSFIASVTVTLWDVMYISLPQQPASGATDLKPCFFCKLQQICFIAVVDFFVSLCHFAKICICVTFRNTTQELKQMNLTIYVFLILSTTVCGGPNTPMKLM